MNKSKIKIGYGVFGKAYEYMFKNDLHDKQSIGKFKINGWLSYSFLGITIFHLGPNKSAQHHLCLLKAR